jgi:hypothetical protein
MMFFFQKEKPYLWFAWYPVFAYSRKYGNKGRFVWMEDVWVTSCGDEYGSFTYYQIKE